MNQRIAPYRRRSGLRAPSFDRIILLVLAAVITFSGVVRGFASDRAFDEYQVKAVFLYRLTLFITWPEETFPPNRPFIIGIIGDDPFGEHIDQVVENEKSKGRPVLVRRYRSIEEVPKAPSQVLFINQALRQKWAKMKQTIEALPILTVSDMDQFCETGGMINIRTQISKLKIEINPRETRKAGLKISSKLLKVSRNVGTDHKGGRR